MQVLVIVIASAIIGLTESVCFHEADVGTVVHACEDLFFVVTHR